MRRACEAVKPGDWNNYLEVFFKDDRLSMWARVEVRECYNEVELEDEGRISIAQDILGKSTDFLRRLIAPSDGAGGVTLSYVCPHCHCLQLEDYIWCVSSGHGKKQCNWWCAACGGQCDGRAPNKVLVIQDSTDHRNTKLFLAHAAPQGMCDHLISALKLLANDQTDSHSPVWMILLGLPEESRRKIVCGLRLFIAVDNYAAVKIGYPQKETRSKKVVRPSFTTDFSGSCYSGRRG